MGYNDYEAVIGLEIHAQLFTKSKIFSGASTTFVDNDNGQVTPVCAGFPGTLPVLNKGAVELAIRTGLALNCEINKTSIFSRKQYFYPDLPKGYQISQYDKPTCSGGYVEFFVDGNLSRVSLERAHMEEDAGKSTHYGDYTLVNLNRAGVPLLEIVSAPEIRTPLQAAEYTRAVRQILRYIGVCDGNLEEGSMRADCNVSVRKKGETKLGTKVELKNINSFKFIEKAIEYEIFRQIECVESGEPIYQETRLYDSAKNKTFSMRSKEEAQDYRYFPDPDLLPLTIDKEWIDKVKSSLPELPMVRFRRFQQEYQLSDNDSQALIQEKNLADYFEATTAVCQNPKASSNWIMSELLREMNENKTEIENSPVTSKNLGEMIQLIDKGTISGKMAKQVFSEMWKTGKGAATLIQSMGLEQITDEGAIAQIINDIILANPTQVEQYRSGKEKVFGFFVGQVMKASKGQANPDAVNKLLKDKLKG
ncbi:MAG: Asp-tRNA(Asn)/Glu-tRNA(Gln) amidotransferase subunit GatB [Bdellovibrionaceae bacterium]|nr:Asp-tRNA(Asn)/Glu-tRNA(Gln) amidotransferase subunit GatB [Pseudobdellovibrionaceae bacterium]